MNIVKAQAGSIGWAQSEFGEVSIGDKRRTTRLVAVASELQNSSFGTLPAVFPAWKDLKAAYRLFAEEDVTHERLLSPHVHKVRQSCEKSGTWLHIEDTTTLSFNSRIDITGLGWTGYDETRGKGMYLHTGLSVCIEGWSKSQVPQITLQGIVNQEWWIRKGSPKTSKESERARWERSRESERWARWYEQSTGPSSNAQWVYVADREADAYEIFERCSNKGINFVIRARNNRALSEDDRHLFAAVGESSCLGQYEVNLRRRGNVKARKAKLEVRAIQTDIRGPWRPGGYLPSYSINVIEVREIEAPSGVEPISWILLTDLDCNDFELVCKVIQMYSCRWLIEEYHKVLKSGVGVEKSQLGSAEGITALIGVLAIVAIKLLNMKLIARVYPDTPLDSELVNSEMTDVLNAKFDQPEQGWTYESALISIAKIGGFLARKNDGMPGWQTIWRGWNKLIALAEGYALAKSLSKCG